MIDEESVRKAEDLMRKYERNWGKKVDLDCVPWGMTQEDFAVVMERIAETGESVPVGFHKCFGGRETIKNRQEGDTDQWRQ